MVLSKEEIARQLRVLQQSICTSIEGEDGRGEFVLDQWERPGGGGGDTRVIENGKVIEKETRFVLEGAPATMARN